MLRTKTIRARRIAQPILLMLVPAAVFVGLGQTQSRGPSERKSPSASELAGDPVAGKAIFDRAGNCLSCHRVGATGSVLGPNLSHIGALVSREELQDKLLNPPVTAAPKNRVYEIVTDDGKAIKGKLLNQGPFSLQMLASDGRLVAFRRSQIRAGHFIDPPRMPSYRGKLTSTQIDDLVAYLASLRVAAN